MEFHANDVSRDAVPSVLGFEGKWGGLLVGGAAVSIFGTVGLCAIGVDLIPAIGISLLPLGAAALFVATMVNGKPPSYALDLILWVVFQFRTWLYRIGGLDTPPQLWVPQKHVPHPMTFGNREEA
jgi:hypothetical protein